MRKDKKGLTGIILAGGQSRRMLKDKALLSFEDKPMLEIIIEKLKRISSEIIVVTNSSLLSRLVSLTKKYKLKMIDDLIPHQGPLGGIYTGLLVSSNLYNFVVACDMPLLNTELINYMKKGIRGLAAVIPCIDGYPQPLFALYSKRCIGPIRKRLLSRGLKVSSFFADVKVRYITDDEITRFDPQYLSFFNINNLDDYSCALRLIKRKKI